MNEYASKKASLFICIFINSIMVVAMESENRSVHYRSLQDLNRYIDSLDAIINFYSRHKNYVDLNFKIGFFLANVHLKSVLKFKHRKRMSRTYTRLKKMLRKSDNLLLYFKKMIEEAVIASSKDSIIKITTLFDNETLWIGNLPTLRAAVLYGGEESESHWRNLNFTAYGSKVFSFEDGVPSPNLSDRCLNKLANNPVYNSEASTTCRLDPRCLKAVADGSDYGYHISHRLLHILAARLGRQCNIFSRKTDRMAIHEFCNKIYAETEFLSRNYYNLIDLFLEQIALCSLAGYAQFLNRTWLDAALLYQTNLGCFSPSIPRHKYKEPGRPKTWKLTRKNNDILGGICNTHVTAVSAATLAPAVRYILGTFNSLV